MEPLVLITLGVILTVVSALLGGYVWLVHSTPFAHWQQQTQGFQKVKAWAIILGVVGMCAIAIGLFARELFQL